MTWRLEVGNSLEVLRAMREGSVDCVVTSPPYWNLREYHKDAVTWPEMEYSPYPGAEPVKLPKENVPLGNEGSIDAYIGHLVLIFRETYRVLSEEGSLYLNIGDTYTRTSGGGYKRKSLLGVPSRLKMALLADGWLLRNDIVWHKTRVLPSKAKDRFTSDHEYVFFFTKKSVGYYFDHVAVREPMRSDARMKQRMIDAVEREEGVVGKTIDDGKAANQHDSNTYRYYSVGNPEKGRNKRTVWSLCTSNFGGAHFATFPEKLVEPCVKASTSEAGKCPVCLVQWRREGDSHEFKPRCGHEESPVPSVVLDPFAGAGTTMRVAMQLKRDSVGIEISEEYANIIRERLAKTSREVYAPWEEGYVEETPLESSEMTLEEILRK